MSDLLALVRLENLLKVGLGPVLIASLHASNHGIIPAIKTGAMPTFSKF